MPHPGKGCTAAVYRTSPRGRGLQSWGSRTPPSHHHTLCKGRGACKDHQPTINQ